VLEKHLMHCFDTSAELPLWNLTVLSDNTAIFFWHHCIGDGISGLAFHRALVAALNADNTIYKSMEVVDIRSKNPLIPAVESHISVRPSVSQFSHALFDLFSPASWRRGASAWSGNPVKESTLRTEVRLLEFSPEENAKFLTCCRAHNATLTPALHTLAVSALSHVLLDQTDHTRFKNISTTIPMSLRPITRTSPDVLCDHISHYHFYPAITSTFSWMAASALTATLRSFREKAAGEMGLLMFLFGQYEAFFKGKIGKKREAGLQVSSIGKFDSAVGTDKWQIDRMIFAQCDVVVGAAIKLNVCGNPLGGLAIAVTWGSDSVENTFVEAFIFKFRQMFKEVIDGEMQ
jgi:hypothetical protein